MADVVKHAWTHREKWLGGTDPIPINLPYAFVSNGAISQTITTTTEVIWQPNEGGTNRPELFAWDPADPAGLLIRRTGLYFLGATLYYQSADSAVARGMYIAYNALSAGPMASIGTAIGDGGFAVGDGQGAAGIATVTGGAGSISKSRLAYFGITSVGADQFGPNDPARVVVFAVHQGTNYEIENLRSMLIAVRLSDFSQAAELPEP